MTFCWGITSRAGRTISRKTEQDFWIWRIFHKCAAMRHGGGLAPAKGQFLSGCDEPPQGYRLRLPECTPIFFLRHQKENAPCTVEKKKCWRSSRHVCVGLTAKRELWQPVRWMSGICTGCAVDLGNRDGAVPHTGAWVRLSGWSSNRATPLFAAASLALPRPEQSGSGGEEGVKSSLHQGTRGRSTAS